MSSTCLHWFAGRPRAGPVWGGVTTLKKTTKAASVVATAAVIAAMGAGLLPGTAFAAGAAPVPRDPADAVQFAQERRRAPGSADRQGRGRAEGRHRAAARRHRAGRVPRRQHERQARQRQVRRARPGEDRQDLHHPGRVRRQGRRHHDVRPGRRRPEPPVKKYGGSPGPAHNTIAEPDRAKDNSTAWQADYNQQHFQDLYFGTDKDKESLKKYYEKQSSGRYSVDGEVSDWVKVPYNEARYGSNYCGEHQLRQRLGPGPRRRQRLGRRPEGQGPHRRADQGGPRPVRPVGPLRLRRRRQLQRARRLHRPLPDRPRR